jgi:hypothetical protein
VQEQQRPSTTHRGALDLIDNAYLVEYARRVAFGTERYCGIMDLAYRMEVHGYAASVRSTKQMALGYMTPSANRVSAL